MQFADNKPVSTTRVCIQNRTLHMPRQGKVKAFFGHTTMKTFVSGQP